ncbi:phosphoglucosamine mutase [Alkalibaculum sp. M08DMB]|uniref:Phosphoglucosamine mutase n=1 Tax=Alkalibaculum sporogenes TaxID=2655001 RepID=A0A6A7KCA1_9FIRM|nr:phosphoglucosamine mutase [Alkalibaculum sporogenes]MPW26807.1 phosphoglucosamine mutase [Alkalibaculum sporogenes]
MGILFGTDGVRGIANKDLTPQLAFELGRAGAFVLSKGNVKPSFVIGKDTRLSGDMLEGALIAGICSMGGDVIKLGVMPTPAVAVLTRHFNADAGIVISASHNPAEFNGIKFFNSEGFKLSDAIEQKIEDLIIDKNEYELPIGDKVGRVKEFNNADEIYVDFLLKSIDGDLTGLKIILDCANGASYKIAPEVFTRLGAQIIYVGVCPDGININHNCGSTHLDLLQEIVLKEGADFGLAFDGDADRLLAVDNLGRNVDGDKIINIFAHSMKTKGTLKKDTVVATVMSNLGLDLALNKINCKCVKTDVGDRYVLETMIRDGYNLGGEQSGHIIVLDYNTTGDGLLTAVLLSSIVKKENITLSQLSDKMNVYPQILVNAKVKNENKYSYKEDEIINNEIEKIEEHFHNRGRVLIRPSGTEPLIRVMIEGENQDELKILAQNLANLIVERLV